MKIFKLSIVVIFALAMIKCTNELENDDQSENVITQQEVSPEVLIKLESMGFDVKTVPPILSKNGYIVDGDINISKKTIEDYNSQRQAFLSIVRCNRAGNIRIKNSLGNNAAGRGFQRGVNLWNRVNGTSLRLVVVNSDPDIDVRVSTSIGGWGLGEFPENGIEGGLILLNINTPHPFIDRAVTAREWGNILTHEIGHNIGLLHSEQGFFGTQISGTPIQDPNSIMTSGSNPRVVFNADRVSRNDKRAIKKMYNDSSNALCR